MKLLTSMTTPTLTAPGGDARSLLRGGFALWPPVAEQRRLLLLSDDETFWRNLLSAASEAGRELVRKRAAADLSRTLQLLKPGVVLLDLDSPAQAAWDAADFLLQDANSPPTERDAASGRSMAETVQLVCSGHSAAPLLGNQRVARLNNRRPTPGRGSAVVEP